MVSHFIPARNLLICTAVVVVVHALDDLISCISVQSCVVLSLMIKLPREVTDLRITVHGYRVLSLIAMLTFQMRSPSAAKMMTLAALKFDRKVLSSSARYLTTVLRRLVPISVFRSSC